MKLFSAYLLILLLAVKPVSADDYLPQDIYLNEHILSYTTSFDLSSKTNKIGTLYRRVLALFLTYDFYDINNQLITTASARFFSIKADFDVYDSQQHRLGFVEEIFLTLFPCFDIYANDGRRLAHAEMNFWGTTFSVYDAQSEVLIATMSRSFFRIVNNWTIKINNPALANKINSNLLLTILAFQTDREYWRQYEKDYPLRFKSHLAKNKQEELSKNFRYRLAKLYSDRALADIKAPNVSELESLAAKTWHQFKQKNGQSIFIGSNLRQNDAFFYAFVDYCIQLIEENRLSATEQKGLLQLLQLRLASIH